MQVHKSQEKDNIGNTKEYDATKPDFDYRDFIITSKNVKKWII